jgi:transcriptional regulator with XRE-family HTH domain
MHKNSYLLKLGRRIAKLREEKGHSQASFARLCNKDPQSHYRIENGIVNISIFNLKLIADKLGITLSELLDFE